MIAPNITYPLSNMQLALLQLYTRNVSEEDLAAIKDLVAQFFAQKAMALADKAWDENGLDADTILNTHIRTPYPKK
jgi:hypothetical protein